MTESTLVADGITARYFETDAERVLAFERGGDEGGATGEGDTDGEGNAADDAATAGAVSTAAIAQNRDGYAMLMVRTAPDGDELERYYGLDMALDHAAEQLGVDPGDLPIPDAAKDMGM